MAFGATGTKAQAVPASDSFTFAGGGPCSSITSLNDSTSYAPNQGSICLFRGDEAGGYGSFLDVPWQLGFLNNGYLAGCDPLSWQTRVFTLGDGTHAGDTFTVAGATTCPYYTGEYGTYLDSNERLDGFSVVASYVVVAQRSCSRYGCHTYLSNALTGGTGTVSEVLLNQ